MKVNSGITYNLDSIELTLSVNIFDEPLTASSLIPNEDVTPALMSAATLEIIEDLEKAFSKELRAAALGK